MSKRFIVESGSMKELIEVDDEFLNIQNYQAEIATKAIENFHKECDIVNDNGTYKLGLITSLYEEDKSEKDLDTLAIMTQILLCNAGLYWAAKDFESAFNKFEASE